VRIWRLVGSNGVALLRKGDHIDVLDGGRGPSITKQAHPLRNVYEGPQALAFTDGPRCYDSRWARTELRRSKGDITQQHFGVEITVYHGGSIEARRGVCRRLRSATAKRDRDTREP
jgi:hypothetical protein